MDRIGKIIVKA